MWITNIKFANWVRKSCGKRKKATSIEYSTAQLSSVCSLPIKIVNDKGDIHEHSFDAGLLLTGRHDFLDGDGKSIEV